MVQRVADCIPDHLLDEIVAEVKGANWRYGWLSNTSSNIFAHWNYEIVPGTAENGLDIAEQLTGAVAETWRHLQATYFPDTVLLRCYANSHTYGVEGYPHRDSLRSHDMTLIIYLNQTWKREWAGETMIFDGLDVEHAELPKYNQGLVFNGNKWHVARGVTRICPLQRITLMFKFSPRDVDLVRDRLQIFFTDLGAEKIQHKNKSFLAHLLGTYDLLKSVNAPDPVCQAGAAHSIFGTNAFRHELLTPDRRQELVAIIGEAAGELVDLFASLDRPQTLEQALDDGTQILKQISGDPIEVDLDTFGNLCLIECANLKEQGSLATYPRLNNMWQARSLDLD